jgi:predicted DCC family thiol-disulfide oxidoreductase YuxK
MAGQDPSALFYDAECGFCRVTAGVVLAWDRDRRLTPIALQDAAAAQQLSDLSEAERMASWHLVAPDGSRRSGGDALAPLFETLPRGVRLAALARRFPAGAERLYAFTAGHRDRLAKLVPSRLRRGAEATIKQRADEMPGSTGEPAPAEKAEQPTRAADGEPAPGFPEPPGEDPGALPGDRDPHHVLNNPVVDDPDPTEWPDPYETREDPRDPADPDGKPFGEEPHPPTGAISTSEPHPSKDPEAGDRWEAPKRDKLDE